MDLNDDSAIERLALSVLDCSLPKPEWTHQAHFATALWLLRHRPELTAPDQIRNIITRYNQATHTPNSDSGGYHHTITLASMRGAASYGHNHAPLHTVLRSLRESPLGHPDWLLAYWRRETLFSVTARRSWVEPDLTALPF